MIATSTSSFEDSNDGNKGEHLITVDPEALQEEFGYESDN